MTPIRETIARAISPYYWAAAGTARDTRAKKVHRDRSLFAADRVLRALDEAGLVVVRKDEFLPSRGREPCAMELEWARQQAQDLDLP